MQCRFIYKARKRPFTNLGSTSKNADDVVITLAIRTPLAKAGKGGFKDTQLDFMIYSLLKKVIEKSNLDPALVEDICLGNVSPVFLAISIPAHALNRSQKARLPILSEQPPWLQDSPTRLPHQPSTASAPPV